MVITCKLINISLKNQGKKTLKKIWGIKRISRKELAEVWDKYGCGEFVFIRCIKESVNAVWYVLKYVNGF